MCNKIKSNPPKLNSRNINCCTRHKSARPPIIINIITDFNLVQVINKNIFCDHINYTQHIHFNNHRTTKYCDETNQFWDEEAHLQEANGYQHWWSALLLSSHPCPPPFCLRPASASTAPRSGDCAWLPSEVQTWNPTTPSALSQWVILSTGWCTTTS